ncbi:MAG: GcrA family cell cycle regulator [Hyphomonadaceae bacterium]
MWTDDRVATLRKLWTDGLSASQIAKQLGGVTRNAVIGKVHRLGLAGRATPSRPAKRIVRAARPRVHAGLPSRPRTIPSLAPLAELPPPLEPQALPDGSVASVLTVTDRMCKWPIGDPADMKFAFCGREACDGPYCAEHARHAFQPQAPRRRKVTNGEPEELRRLLRYASM